MQHLTESYRAGNLPHALLLVMDQAAAKEQITELVEQLRLNVADQLFFVDETPIKVADARRIRQFTELSRFTSPIKLVFVANATLLTTEAANALLKTLEEPPRHCHLILATRHLDELLPTIRSRCQIIHGPLTGASVTTDNPLPALPDQNQLTAFETTKALAAGEIALPELLNAWLTELQNRPSSAAQHKAEAVLLRYLPLAATPVNRRLLLDNLVLDLYNPD